MALPNWLKLTIKWVVIIGTIFGAVYQTLAKALSGQGFTVASSDVLAVGVAVGAIVGFLSRSPLFMPLFTTTEDIKDDAKRSLKPPPLLCLTLTVILTALCSGCVKAGQILADVGQVTLCVDNEVLQLVASGLTTFEDIATALAATCGPTTAANVEAIVAVLQGKSTTSDEMKKKLAALHHKGAV